jgi:hypothetical protein
MKFKKQFLQDMLWEDVEGAEVIHSEIVGKSRWSLNHEAIFKYEDKFYRTYYNTAATEQQDERPYEFDDDEIECEEVVPVEKIITVYETKK